MTEEPEAQADQAAQERRSNAKLASEKAAAILAKTGRPTDYTDELADQMCELLTTRTDEGRVRSLRKVCQELELAECTVYRWLDGQPAFRLKYERACLIRATMDAHDTQEIADNATDPHKARLQIDARKWTAARMDPKRWGDRVVMAGDKDNPLFDPLGSVLAAVDGKTRGLPKDDG